MSKQLKNGLFIRLGQLGLEEVQLKYVRVILRYSVAFQLVDYFKYKK